MDIDLLSNMVKELILGHDSVELTGFGTFVAIRMPASFSDRGYTINPPYRKLNFLLGDHPSDGLLVDLYANSNSIERSDSESILRKFFLDLKDILSQEKILVFPGVGVVKLARNNVCLFVQDEDLDISPDYYGLSSLSLKSTVKVTNSRPIVLAAQGKATNTQSDTAQPSAPVPVAAEAAVKEQNNEAVKRENTSKWWLIPVIFVIVAAVLLVAFLALAHFAPDLMDKLLYTEEQLQILHTDLETLLN